MTLHNAHVSSGSLQVCIKAPVTARPLDAAIVHFMTALSERVGFLHLADLRRGGIFRHTADTRQEHGFHLCHIIEPISH